MLPNPLVDEVSMPAADNDTYFSSFPFIAAVAATLGPGHRSHPLPVTDRGPLRQMYALERRERLGSRSLLLAPYWLWASPGWEADDLRIRTIREILGCMQTPLTRGFTWNVRFDHSALARRLQERGLHMERTSTHVLRLSDDYATVFRRYNRMIRCHVRRSLSAGVCVRSASTPADVDEYYRMHCAVAASKGGFRTTYPVQLFHRLIQDQSSVRLLIAEWEGRLVAGGLFFRDGSSLMYWHGATDRQYSKVFPACAVLDCAIRYGCETGAKFLNLGGSSGIPSLEAFKSFWGAAVEWNWSFEWRNPMWSGLSRVNSILRTRDA
jgi:hypothetical protein